MKINLILLAGSALLSCTRLEVDSRPIPNRILMAGGNWFFPEQSGVLLGEDQEVAGHFENGATAIMGPRVIVGLKPGHILTENRRRFLDVLGLYPLIESEEVESRIMVFEGTSAVQVLKSSLIDIISQESWVDFVHPDFRLIFRDESHLSLKPATELSKSMGEWPLEPTPGTEPLFPKTWHLDAIQAPTFWTHTKGMPQVTIAVIDLGFEADHPDLKSAWRAHPGEIPENGLDDDGNGYVDDVRGWNFATGNQNLIYGAGPGHGTATSGIVGARENSIGTLGVCPRCSMLPLVIDDRVSTAILAFQYAKAQGASVVSNSWGYSLDLPVMQGLVVAIDELTKEGRGGKGASVVFAMGNSRRDDCGGRSPDLSSLEQVIAVSSVGHNLKKVNSSGYGPCLDLVAPSSATPQGGIVTTDRVGVKGFNSGQKEELTDLNYTQRFYGTSAAAPQVSGALGLIYSRWDGISRQVAESMLMQKTQKVHQDTAAYDPRSGKSKEYGYGLLFLGF